jgi:hypothetical protein
MNRPQLGGSIGHVLDPSNEGIIRHSSSNQVVEPCTYYCAECLNSAHKRSPSSPKSQHLLLGHPPPGRASISHKIVHCMTFHKPTSAAEYPHALQSCTAVN